MGRSVTDHPPDHRPIFTLRIEGAPGAEGIHALRALLKVLLRKYGFKCLDAREVLDQPDDPAKKGLTASPTTAAKANHGSHLKAPDLDDPARTRRP
jgi:hypothetical protein